MRGAQVQPAQVVGPLRIIPADAGSTPSRPYTSCPSEDHPRGCGEHVNGAGSVSRYRGSSPRMRGARGRQLEPIVRGRIIPADAGSTLLDVGGVTVRKDHPRGCGEHVVEDGHVFQFSGSSPRMRGAPGPDPVRPRPIRIIPADAGSTRRRACPSWWSADHPRGCGEHNMLVDPVPRVPGSSPRMRGAR